MSTSEPVPPRTIGRDGKSYPSRRKPKPVITPKPDVEPARTTEDCAQPGNSGRNQDGTFAKGVSGNIAGKPKGARHRATLLAESLIDSSGELLVNKCVAMAMAGDAAAMRLAMERLCPPRRERPVNITMPKINVAADLIAAAAALTDAVAEGEVTPGEAASLSMLVGNTAKAIETFELAERLAKLEEQMAVKGSNR
jgi:Family of unknown function (DUF5681)